MLKIIIIILLLLSTYDSLSQELDSRCLLSLIYIESNNELNKEIRNFFKRDIPKKSRIIPFQVSDKIVFIDITPFKEDLVAISQLPIDLDIFKARNAFKEKYKFESFSSGALGNLLPVKPDNLILRFSKPIGNILAVELTDFEMRLPNSVKFGKGFRILFVFNEKGLIEKFFLRTFVYN